MQGKKIGEDCMGIQGRVIVGNGVGLQCEVIDEDFVRMQGDVFCKFCGKASQDNW